MLNNSSTLDRLQRRLNVILARADLDAPDPDRPDDADATPLNLKEINSALLALARIHKLRNTFDDSPDSSLTHTHGDDLFSSSRNLDRARNLDSTANSYRDAEGVTSFLAPGEAQRNPGNTMTYTPALTGPHFSSSQSSSAKDAPNDPNSLDPNFSNLLNNLVATLIVKSCNADPDLAATICGDGLHKAIATARSQSNHEDEQINDQIVHAQNELSNESRVSSQSISPVQIRSPELTL